MSKKINKGFTLAEVLITLGIIGVVAALTAPALIQNAGNAKIGPTLQKVKSTIENANEQILYENEASNLYAVADNTSGYMELLSEYISGSSYNSTSVSTSAGFDIPYKTYNGSTWSSFMVKVFSFSQSLDLLFLPSDPSYNAIGSFAGGYKQLLVDINGSDTTPNTFGKDVFWFLIDYNGTVIPYGGKTYMWLLTKGSSTTPFWNTSGTSACNESSITYGYYCAGSIFDNGLKVIYQ